jgi:hypothetical protein
MLKYGTGPSQVMAGLDRVKSGHDGFAATPSLSEELALMALGIRHRKSLPASASLP